MASQAEVTADLSITVLHQVGDRHDHAVAVLRLADFMAWFGEIGVHYE